jgi:hypothetical protein
VLCNSSDLSGQEQRYVLSQNLQDLRPANHGGSVVVEAQGRLFKVQVQYVTNGVPKACVSMPVRGRVGGFSAKSRKRLLEKLARLDHEKSGKVSFLTLTYPKYFPTPQRAKEHLRAWCKRVAARYPAFSAVWRLELQRRGAPHFHLLCFGLPFVPKEWVQRTWAAVIGQPGVEVFTRIEAMRSWRGAMHYASKYIAKVQDFGQDVGYVVEMPECKDGAVTVLTAAVPGGLDSLPYLAVAFDHVGRWWGVFNEDGLPWASLERGKLPFGKWFYHVKRSAEHVWAFVNTRERQGFTLFVDDPGQWMRYAQAAAGVAYV